MRQASEMCCVSLCVQQGKLVIQNSSIACWMQVIRSLKRALQPAVTDVSVEFKVPPEFEVLQSPKNLPPVFNGEKMVVYAIIKQQGAHVRVNQGLELCCCVLRFSGT